MERSSNGDRNTVLVLAVGAGRLGIATGRFVLRPARAVTRAAWREPIVRAGTESVASAARVAGVGALTRVESATVEVLAAPEAAHAVDIVLASPLPEAVGRSLADHRVLERVVAEVLANDDLERAIVATLENERTSRLVGQVLASPALERLLTEALESRLTTELAERMIRSPEFDHLLEQAVSSPAVRVAMARQTQGFAEETAAALRRRAVRMDDSAERAPRRLVGKPARPVATPERPAVPQAGIATRGIALVVDALLAQTLFLVFAATVWLVASLVDGSGSTWLVGAAAGIGWLVAVGVYFVAFWSAAGQTPGMRLMRLRLLDGSGRPPGVWRSVLRLIGLDIAIAVFFLGFVPVLFDGRRRALQDFLAGTAVYYDELTPRI